MRLQRPTFSNIQTGTLQGNIRFKLYCTPNGHLQTVSPTTREYKTMLLRYTHMKHAPGRDICIPKQHY